MITHIRQPFFTVACETIFVHHDLATTKWPRCANEVVAFCFDLMMLKMHQVDSHTMRKTKKPIPAPRKMLVIRPHTTALSRSSSLIRMVVRDELFVSFAEFSEFTLIFQASQAIRQRSKSVADCVVLMSGGHSRHAVRNLEDELFKSHGVLLRGQQW